MSLAARMARRPRRYHRRAGLTGGVLTLQTLFGGMLADSATDAGPVVTVEKASGLPAFGNAVRALSRDVGTLPLLTYRRQADDDRQRVPRDPTYRLLRQQPNVHMVAPVFWTTVMRHLVGWGNAFIGKELTPLPSGGFEVTGLWPIRPEQVIVRVSGGRKIFEVITATDGVRHYDSDLVIHVMLDSDDGYVGVSPVAQHRQALGHGIALAQYGSKALDNRAVPTGALRIKKPLTDPDAKRRLRAEWEKLYRSSAQAHRIAILDEDAEFQPLSIPLVDAQFIEQRRFGIVEVAQILNMPVHKLQGSTGDSLTYTTREANQLEYLTSSLRPYLVAIQDALNADQDVFPPRRRMYCEHLVDALLSVDTMTRARANALATGGAPWKRPSEVRTTENLPADEGFDYVPTKAAATDGLLKEDQANANG